jgi:uncharacterized protein with beta-barrel porin domain
MSGPGSGTITLPGSGCDASEIILSGTTQHSNLTISTRRSAKTSVRNIVVAGSIQTIKAASVNLAGDIQIAGSASKITMGNAAGGLVSIGQDVKLLKAVNLTFGQVQDLSINSSVPIKQIKASQWLDTDGVADSVYSPSTPKLRIVGQDDLVLNPPRPAGDIIDPSTCSALKLASGVFRTMPHLTQEMIDVFEMVAPTAIHVA